MHSRSADPFLRNNLLVDLASATNTHNEHQARELGKVVRRHVLLANQHTDMWVPTGAQDPELWQNLTSSTPYVKVAPKWEGYLQFSVAGTFNYLQRTPAWLPKSDILLLRLSGFESDIPEDTSSFWEEPTRATEVYCMRSPNRLDSDPDARVQPPPHTAFNEEGTALTNDQTRTIIDILRLMADRYEHGSSAATPPDGPHLRIVQ